MMPIYIYIYNRNNHNMALNRNIIMQLNFINPFTNDFLTSGKNTDI